ncbi:MAG: bifunctional riboflavin kinase/FAD synthetase [Candidatus Zhuqueibacterota bacterium]
MEIFNDLGSLQQNSNCVITIGTFDGVHLGHQSIIRTLKEKAEEYGCCTTIVTFEPHPQFVIQPKRTNGLKLLTLIDEKIAILEKLGIDRLIVIPFTPEFSQLSSLEFIEKILIAKIGFKYIIIGYDHAFGKNRDGNQQVLEQLRHRFNYQISAVLPFRSGDVVISSTQIRKLILNGDIETAAQYMGRNYQISGKVIHGEGRGRTMRVPTANILPWSEEKLIPKSGIYAAWAYLGQRKLRGVLYIGTRPTFSNHQVSIEMYIFDFDEDIYGESITIELKNRIRDDLKFEGAEKLIAQIELDKKQTLELLNN